VAIAERHAHRTALPLRRRVRRPLCDRPFAILLNLSDIWKAGLLDGWRAVLCGFQRDVCGTLPAECDVLNGERWKQ